ncbi:MAG: hypothetical protein U0575_03675 [Phycisphaerales bacterium]
MVPEVPTSGRTESMRDFVERWTRLGPILAQIEAEETRSADVATTMRAFSGMVLFANRMLSPEKSSGLVEMQRLFAKLR